MPPALARFWFQAQLLALGGHAPNLYADNTGAKLQPGQTYTFNLDDMCFSAAERGRFSADHIKFLRLSFAGTSPKLLAQVQGSGMLVDALAPIMQAAARTYVGSSL